MLPTTIPASDTTKICPAVAIWLVPASQSGHESCTRSNQIQPFEPRSTVFEFIAAADFRRKTGQPEGELFVFLIAPAELHTERVEIAPFVPKQHISAPPCYAKPGNDCAPRTSGLDGIEFACAPGRKDRRGRLLGAALPVPPPLACEPHAQTEAWRAAALKPFQPLPSKPSPLVLRAQTGGSKAIRPKQGLRELALPSPRPWHSLTVLWESFDGVHFAMPIPESAAAVRLPNPTSIAPWNMCVDAALPGRRFLRESAEIPFDLQPSLEGARTLLAPVEMLEAIAPFLPGLDKPLRGGNPSVETAPIPEAALSEMLPLPMSPKTPLPGIALPEGLLIWSGSINSYIRRYWCAPRLREGGRVVHTLRLAPSSQVSESVEVSVA
jgi:hypothetical protein